MQTLVWLHLLGHSPSLSSSWINTESICSICVPINKSAKFSHLWKEGETVGVAMAAESTSGVRSRGLLGVRYQFIQFCIYLVT